MSALTIEELGRLQKLLDVCAVNVTNVVGDDDDAGNRTSESMAGSEYAVMYSSSIKNVTQYRAILKVKKAKSLSSTEG